MAAKFEVVSPFQPAGDQPAAIAKLVEGFRDSRPYQTLLGATGTGKSVAWDEPVLVRHTQKMADSRWPLVLLARSSMPRSNPPSLSVSPVTARR